MIPPLAEVVLDALHVLGHATMSVDVVDTNEAVVMVDGHEPFTVYRLIGGWRIGTGTAGVSLIPLLEAHLKTG